MKLDRLKLQKLTLSGDEQSEDLTNYLIELCRAQSSLQYLKIKGIVTFNETNHLLLSKIGKICPNLSFLQIIGTYVDLAFLHSFSKLQALKLSGDPDTSVTIQFKGDDPSNLKELHLKKIHFEDSCLQQHLPKMPNLRSMSLNWCTFNYWSNLLEALKSLNQLQSLTLNGINVNELDDCTLDGFATTVNHLQLSHCEMSPKLLAMVLGGCPRLRRLHLQAMELTEKSAQRTESAVVHVVCRMLPTLNTLIIKECALAVEEVNFIRGSCKSLKELKITGSL